MECYNCKKEVKTTKISFLSDNWDICDNCRNKIKERSLLAHDKMKTFVDRYSGLTKIGESIHIRAVRGTSKKDQKYFDEFIVGYGLGQLEVFSLWEIMNKEFNLSVGLTNWNVCFRGGKRTVKYGITEYFAIKFSKI